MRKQLEKAGFKVVSFTPRVAFFQTPTTVFGRYETLHSSGTHVSWLHNPETTACFVGSHRREASGPRATSPAALTVLFNRAILNQVRFPEPAPRLVIQSLPVKGD